MNQNLSSYWIFYTVANAGNISKAAKELYISQPAIVQVQPSADFHPKESEPAVYGL